MDQPDEYSARLERAKRGSAAQLLFRCARLVNERALARLQRTPGLEGLREAHLRLFPFIALEGTRLTDLAARLGVTKQATSQLVAELEAMGVLEKRLDPLDGRARLITFSERGRQGLLQGLGLLGEVEGELRAALGDATLDALHEALLALHDHLEAEERAG